MNKYRLRFEKTGRSIYISHLDLMQVFQRAFFRAGINLAYSEGFNPHPQISVAMPLPLGCASICELLDFKSNDILENDDFCSQINKVMPEGIRALKLYTSETKASGIMSTDFEILFKFNDSNLEDIKKGFSEFFRSPDIPVDKKSKRGMLKLNLAQYSELKELEIENGMLKTVFNASAQEPVINPALIVDALAQNAFKYEPEYTLLKRLENYDKEHHIFM